MEALGGVSGGAGRPYLWRIFHANARVFTGPTREIRLDLQSAVVLPGSHRRSPCASRVRIKTQLCRMHELKGKLPKRDLTWQMTLRPSPRFACLGLGKNKVVRGVRA